MAFEELKQRQGVVWGSAPFVLIADRISDVHHAVVEAVGEVAGKRWLDVACGTGGVAEPAARAGADVTGIDLAPALIEIAGRRAAEQGLDIDYRVGDAESLDVDDASFDVVTSSFGVMFAPDQSRAAEELARITPPGGKLALATWLPDGGIGAMFEMIAPFQPPMPDDAGVPLDWGRQEHVEKLLGDAFELDFENRTSVDSDESGEAIWQFYIENFGPVKTLAGMLDVDRREELHRAWVDFFETNYRLDGGIEYPREWLLVTGTRR
jgi:SAM-dependent methyltransferase